MDLEFLKIRCMPRNPSSPFPKNNKSNSYVNKKVYKKTPQKHCIELLAPDFTQGIALIFIRPVYF